MIFNIPGNPIPQQRPRMTKSGTVYNPQAQEKKVIAALFRSQMSRKGYLIAHDGHITVELMSYMPKPSSLSQKRLKCEFLPHTIKPDVDNIAKFYLDCMNGVVFRDDSQVISLTSKKIYCNKPRVQIFLTKRFLVKEHIYASKNELTYHEVMMLLHKANRIGLNGRELIEVQKQELDGLTHYFFITEPKCAT